MRGLRQRLDKLLRRRRLNAATVVRIDRRHVYILPTRYGWLFALLLVLMLVASLNYDNNPAYLLTFLLIGLALNAMYLTWRNLHGLELRLLAPVPVFAGEALELRLQPSPGSRPALVFSLAGSVWLDDLDRAAREVSLQVRTHRRGRMRPGNLEIATSYPLGLFRAWSLFELADVLVYPRPAAEAELPLAPSLREERPGEKEGDEEFYGLRDFRPGDPLSHVDWKGLARERGLLTKQFEDPDQRAPLVIDWKLFAPADIETRLSKMTRLVIEAEQAHRPYGLSLPGLTLGTGLGTKHFHRCLEALALFREPLDESE